MRNITKLPLCQNKDDMQSFHKDVSLEPLTLVSIVTH